MHKSATQGCLIAAALPGTQKRKIMSDNNAIKLTCREAITEATK